MKKISYLIICFIFISLQADAAEFRIESTQLSVGTSIQAAQVLNGFGCTGQNISPELHWKNAPAKTKSFAVTLYDPDAPTGSGWWHWTVFNIPGNISSLPAGAGGGKKTLPSGAIEGRTDFGSSGYGGPCPPKGHGPHRYQFRVWALDVANLPLDENSPGAMVGFFLKQHKIGMAELVVTFER